MLLPWYFCNANFQFWYHQKSSFFISRYSVRGLPSFSHFLVTFYLESQESIPPASGKQPHLHIIRFLIFFYSKFQCRNKSCFNLQQMLLCCQNFVDAIKIFVAYNHASETFHKYHAFFWSHIYSTSHSFKLIYKYSQIQIFRIQYSVIGIQCKKWSTQCTDVHFQ